MKLAFFNQAGVCERIFSGQPVDAETARADPRYTNHTVIVLDDTAYADAMTIYGLPNLSEMNV